jgi:hypothetical protein
MDTNPIIIPVEIKTQELDKFKNKLKDVADSVSTIGQSKDAWKKFDKELLDVRKNIESIAKGTKEFDKENQKIPKIRSEYRKAANEVAYLAEQYGIASEQVKEAAKRAAELNEKIQISSAVIKSYEPGKKFDALRNSLKGVAAAYEGAEAANVLFGNASEKTKEKILKLQAAMAFTHALSEIGELGKSFKVLGVQLKSTTAYQTIYNAALKLAALLGSKSAQTTLNQAAASKADAVAKAAEAAATEETVVATEGATVATNGFAAAIAATGIGAILVGLGLLIGHFKEIKKFLEDLFPVIGKVFNFLGGLINKITDFFGFTSQKERDLKEAIESQEKTLEKQEGYYKRNAYKFDEYTKKKIEANQEYAKSIIEVNKALKEGKITEKEAAQQRLELAQKVNYEIAQADKERADEVKKVAEEKRKKAAEEAKKAAEEIKKLAEDALNNLKAQNQEEINQTKDKSKERYDATIKGLDKEMEYYKKHWKALGIGQGKLNELIANLNKEKLKLTEQQLKEEQKAADDYRKKDEKAKLEIATLDEKDLKKSLQARIDLINQSTSEQLAAEGLTENQKVLIRKKADIQIKAIQDDETKRQIDVNKQKLDAITKEADAQAKQIEKTVAKDKEKYDKLRAIEDDAFAKKLARLKEVFDQEKALYKSQGKDITGLVVQYNANVDKSNADHTIKIKTYNEIQKKSEEEKVKAIESATTAVADLFGKSTAVAKGMAIAEATINAYKAAAQVFAKDTPGAPPPISLAIRIASAVSALANGIKTVAAIKSTKVPGGAGSSTPTPSVPSFSAFQAPQLFGIGGTRITDSSQLNQNNKVFVTEQDISRVQARVNQVRKASVQGA